MVRRSCRAIYSLPLSLVNPPGRTPRGARPSSSITTTSLAPLGIPLPLVQLLRLKRPHALHHCCFNLPYLCLWILLRPPVCCACLHRFLQISLIGGLGLCGKGTAFQRLCQLGIIIRSGFRMLKIHGGLEGSFKVGVSGMDLLVICLRGLQGLVEFLIIGGSTRDAALGIDEGAFAGGPALVVWGFFLFFFIFWFCWMD